MPRKAAESTPSFVRVATAARQLRVTRQTVYNFIAHGRLVGWPIDGQVFVRAADVERLIVERSAAPRA